MGLCHVERSGDVIALGSLKTILELREEQDCKDEDCESRICQLTSKVLEMGW